MVAIAAILAGAALLFGLTGSALWTGRIDPLDWVLTGTVAIICLTALRSRAASSGPASEGGEVANGARSRWLAGGLTWALVVLPIAVLLGNAAGRVPVAGVMILASALALVTTICMLAERWSGKGRLLTYGLCVVGAIVTPWMSGPVTSGASPPSRDSGRPQVAVFTALPLQGVAFGAAHGLRPEEAIGLRSALWHVLEERADLQPLDALEGAQLAGVDAVLLAQPRLLSPEELVALDAWVRGGGRAVILADPFLHWPDPRPLADPARAPLTSLLDPLLTHWGLRLESAEMDVGGDMHRHGSDEVDRWVLDSGAMLQLAGASRFTVLPDSQCRAAEEGLVARCDIGHGHALLVADADWIDDMLWTLAPEMPADRREWTSDAPEVLASWLMGEAHTVSTRADWLVDQDSLLRAVRASLLLILLFSCAWAIAVRRFSISHEFPAASKGQKMYRVETKGDHP